jgi:hypothetical protein
MDEQLDLQAMHRVRDRWGGAQNSGHERNARIFIQTRHDGSERPFAPHDAASGGAPPGSTSFSIRIRERLQELKQEWDELDRHIEQAHAYGLLCHAVMSSRLEAAQLS